MTNRTALAVLLLTCGCGSLVTSGDILSTRNQQGSGDAGCTPWSDVPNWPVKVVFVVENGGKMCVADPPGSQLGSGFCEAAVTVPAGVTQAGRLRTVSAFFRDNAPRANVSIATVLFDEAPHVFGFRPAAAAAPPGLAEQQARLGYASDLQGGLDAAEALLEQDIQGTSTAERARSRYVVVVLSTGLPYPRCSANDAQPTWATALNPELPWRDDGTFCNDGPLVPGTFAGFTLGGDRNQPSQLLAQVDRLRALANRYGVGEVTVHSRLVLSQPAAESCGAICRDMFPPGTWADIRTLAAWGLNSMATRGAGTWADPGDPQAISLSAVNTSEFTSLCP